MTYGDFGKLRSVICLLIFEKNRAFQVFGQLDRDSTPWQGRDSRVNGAGQFVMSMAVVQLGVPGGYDCMN